MRYKDKLVVQLYVSEDMYSQIKELSEKNEMSVSSFLRQIVRKELDRVIENNGKLT